MTSFPKSQKSTEKTFEKELRHVPVLLSSTVDGILSDPEGLYVDATIGTGGHARALLDRLGSKARLLGLDPDSEQLERARRRCGEDPRLFLVRGWADSIGQAVLSAWGRGAPVSGIVADFGLSWDQLLSSGRGFSFQKPEEILDMRFGPEDGSPPAWEIIRDSGEAELEALLGRGGVVRDATSWSRRLKSMPVPARVADLLGVAPGRRGRRHPATLVFQALRMEVNRELERISKFLDAVPGLLSGGGRLAVISYHSLEDRIVKNWFRRNRNVQPSPRRAIKAGREEARSNPASRSARLRLGEKLR